MKKAREVLYDHLVSVFGGSENTSAKKIESILSEAGFVILPREPDEGMIRAGLQAIMAEIFDAPEDSDTLAVIRNRATAACYRAMLSNYESRQEGEK